MGGRTLATDDEDLDGLPDAWEMQYFGGTWQNGAGGDDDQDGLSNLREYQLGSNPTNGLTRGVFAGPALIPGGRLQLRLNGEPGLSYRLLVSTNLFDWSPGPAVTNLGGVILIEEPISTGLRKFYRTVYP
jgi:hypothetical protein